MAMESRADWDKRQVELKKQQDLKIEKNADALAGPGIDRNALAAEMHKERMLDPGRRQHVALEGNFAQRLGIVAENDKSPQAEAVRKVFSNPEVVRSFIMEPDETAKLLARTYPEYKNNLENAKLFSMVNGKPVINENSYVYLSLKDAKVDHKNVMKHPLAKDVDHLLKGIHGREEDIFKAMGAHIELKRKQGELEAGHFSAKEKKGLQSDIKSLESRVEHELKEVKNNTTSRIADKDFKFTRAILEKEPVTAASIAARQQPTVAVAAPAAEKVPEVAPAPETVYQAELSSFVQGVSKASTLQELREAEKGLKNSIPLEGTVVRAGDLNVSVIDGKGQASFVSVDQVLKAKEREFSTELGKKLDGEVVGATSAVGLRDLEAKMMNGLDSADQKMVQDYYKSTHGGRSIGDIVAEKRNEFFARDAQAMDVTIKNSTDVAALKESRKIYADGLTPEEKKAFDTQYVVTNGKSHDKALNEQIKQLTDVDANERLAKIEKAITGIGTDMPLLANAIDGVTPEVGRKIGLLYANKHGESLETAFKNEMKISAELRKKYLIALGLQVGDGEKS